MVNKAAEVSTFDIGDIVGGIVWKVKLIAPFRISALHTSRILLDFCFMIYSNRL